MPTYDYRCNDCTTQFKTFHPISGTADSCPQCGQESVERLILRAPPVHGDMARGREAAARSLPQCGKGCSCCP